MTAESTQKQKPLSNSDVIESDELFAACSNDVLVRDYSCLVYDPPSALYCSDED